MAAKASPRRPAATRRANPLLALFERTAKVRRAEVEQIVRAAPEALRTVTAGILAAQFIKTALGCRTLEANRRIAEAMQPDESLVLGQDRTLEARLVDLGAYTYAYNYLIYRKRSPADLLAALAESLRYRWALMNVARLEPLFAAIAARYSSPCQA